MDVQFRRGPEQVQELAICELGSKGTLGRQSLEMPCVDPPVAVSRAQPRGLFRLLSGALM